MEPPRTTANHRPWSRIVFLAGAQYNRATARKGDEKSGVENAPSPHHRPRVSSRTITSGAQFPTLSHSPPCYRSFHWSDNDFLSLYNDDEDDYECWLPCLRPPQPPASAVCRDGEQKNRFLRENNRKKISRRRSLPLPQGITGSRYRCHVSNDWIVSTPRYRYISTSRHRRSLGPMNKRRSRWLFSETAESPVTGNSFIYFS